MRKCSILLLVSFVVTVLFSCQGNSAASKLLDEVEGLMNERPDSALYLLENISVGKLGTKRLKAEYSLLMSMALDKNYIDLTSDSLINTAVDHYRGGKDYEKQFLSLYYQGRVYENAGQYTRAMLSFTEAEQLIDKVENDFAKGLLYAHLGKLHDRLYDYAPMLIASATR